MEKELFLTIVDYPFYEVSDLGRVRNIRTNRILSPIVNNRGWAMVNLHAQGRQRMVTLSRLVATMFLGPPEPPRESVVNLDGDRMNNRAQNLEWVPRWFSGRYMREITWPQFHRNEKLMAEKTGDIFNSVAHAASSMIVLPTVIHASVYGEENTNFPGYGALVRV